MRMHACILLLIILLTGCNINKVSDFQDTVTLACTQKFIEEDLYIRYPFRVRVIDSMMYIMDLHAIDHYCHEFYYPEMKHKRSFATRGEAPGEYLDAENIRVGKSQGIWMLDANKKKMAEFIPTSAIGVSTGKEIDLTRNLIRPLDFDFYNDSIFIVPDYSGHNRFCFVNMQGEIIDRWYTIPTKQHKDEDCSGIPLAQAWRSFLNYNRDNGILALVTQLGQVLEVYDLKNDSLVNIFYGKEGEPQFKLVKDKGFSVPTGIMGYSDVWVGKENIYAIFWGHSFDDIMKNPTLDGGKYIHVFDLKGNPVREYVLDNAITGFCVNEEERKFIALAINKDQPVIEYVF